MKQNWMLTKILGMVGKWIPKSWVTYTFGGLGIVAGVLNYALVLVKLLWPSDPMIQSLPDGDFEVGSILLTGGGTAIGIRRGMKKDKAAVVASQVSQPVVAELKVSEPMNIDKAVIEQTVAAVLVQLQNQSRDHQPTEDTSMVGLDGNTR